jgi:WhiB family redox-sensing transcriptional regulator
MSEVVDDDIRWQESGLCRQVDADVWFPADGASANPAKRICMACEVRQNCLDEALANNERFGVWGGASERERRRMRSGEIVVLREPKPRKPARPCLTCGTEVTGHALAKYCSKPCLRTAERERWNAKRRKAA